MTSRRCATPITSIPVTNDASRAFSLGTNMVLNPLSFAQIVEGRIDDT